MRINDKEIIEYSFGLGDKDGRVNHRIFYMNSLKESSIKERWIKLKGNLLFFYKINEYGGLNGGSNCQTPSFFFLLEGFKVKKEENNHLPNSFSIIFDADLDKKHIFSCMNQLHCDDWVNRISNASYQLLKYNIQKLQIKIKQKTGIDPLSNLPNFNLFEI